MHLKHKYLKTKQWFAAGLISMVGSSIYAQVPEDTLHYYQWSKVIDADPDTIHAIDFSRDKIERIPKKLCQFDQLRGLKLTKNKLTELPDFFRDLDSLRFLYIDKNEFTFFPSQIFHLKELVYLDISRNEIGAIPKGITNLSNLRHFDIWDNRLVKIDPAFKELQKLEYLDLRGTTFSPSFVKQWTEAFPNATVEFDKPCDCLE